MKKLFSAFLVFSLYSSIGFSQQKELTDLVAQLQALCARVESGSKNYEQEIKLTEYSSIQYTAVETDQKGNKTQFVYQLNFADLDIYATRQVTQKDVITVVLAVKNKQKLIKGTKNNDALPYDNEVALRARNVDQAREMLDIVKKCIPLGEKIAASKLKLNGYQEMITWLIDHTGNVALGNKSISQSLKPDSYVGSYTLMQIENDGKTSQQEEFTFNIADINPNTINFKVNGNRFGVGFEMMQRLKTVKVIRDGKPRAFNDEVLVYTNNVDEARDIKTVLEMALPLAATKVKTDLPNFKSKEESLDKIAALVKDVKLGEKTYGQTSTPRCLTEITQVEQSSSSTVKNLFSFNYMDVYKDGIQLKTSGEKMLLELPMQEKKKLVMRYKNEKFEGYENDFSILVTDYEVARRLKHAIERTIDGCRASFKEVFPSSNAAIISWLKTNIGEVTIDQVTKKQSFELAEEGNENKIKLTNTELKSSSSVQEVFEFNLSDINPTSVNYEIKGKWLYVTFETNFKNKIIKAYKDGKIQPYVYSVDILVKDIETARSTITALKRLAENLKGK
ncbi:MAG: hypothetical protein ACK5SJ_15645 [Bacteroidota bacterium]|nr:hypothetical protein [Cytophagales bacterium]